VSVELQFDDFTATGVLGSEWTATGGTFIQDGQRARPAAANVYSRAIISAVPPFSASTPIKGRYEVDVLLPAAFPASGVVRGGVVFAGGYGHLVWHRSSGGGSTVVDFFGRTAAGAETSFFSTSLPLSAGATVRLRAAVVYYSFALVVEAWYSTNGGQTYSLLFTSSPSTAAWNTATGQSLASITDSARTGGIVADAPTDLYLDNFRLTDTGNLTATPAIDEAPTLTAFPTLTPYTLSDEDDGGSEVMTVQPSYAVEVTDQWTVTEHPYDGGYTGMTAVQSVRRRAWSFRWDALNATDVVSLGNLRTAVYSTRYAFEWTEPTTDEVIRIRFTTPPTFVLVGPLIWQGEALVHEVLADA
jgi:hypothetical protein